MALYTPPSLPHSPTSYPAQPPLPPLPIELLHTWSSWRSSKPDALLTPPPSGTPFRRVLHPQPHLRTVLPSIAHLDHALSRVSPLTPPQADDTREWRTSGSASFSFRHPATTSPPPEPCRQSYTAHPDPPYVPRDVPFSPQPNLDWFSDIEHQSSHFIAEKTCEMICYLWFSSLSQSSSPSKKNRVAQPDRVAYIPESNPSTASLQFSVSPAFVRFMQKVLETTQVSQSVIVLSLHYIYRMKERNRFTSGYAGSEYRVAIAALMMANKFVDDNTYTNKTWSEVSGIDLIEVNKMEKEFLLGIDFGLFVDKSTYDSWLNLLRGLVMAKERELQHWRRSWRPTRSVLRGHLPKSHARHVVRSFSTAQRARSSSPQRTFSGTSMPYSFQPVIPPSQSSASYAVSAPSGQKRTAAEAFNPADGAVLRTESHPRFTGLTLQIPEMEHPSRHSSENSASPLDSLRSFSKMSLNGASPLDAGSINPWASAIGQHQVPRTLASSYRVDDKRSYAVPENLYFYTLTCSPADSHNSRKGRLRYHQPHASNLPHPVIEPSIPMVVQSASASPYDMHERHTRVLPPFSDISRQRVVDGDGAYAGRFDVYGQYPRADQGDIPSAPFANAGPPGFQLYTTAVPASVPQYYDGRGRQL